MKVRQAGKELRRIYPAWHCWARVPQLGAVEVLKAFWDEQTHKAIAYVRDKRRKNYKVVIGVNDFVPETLEQVAGLITSPLAKVVREG